MKYIEKVIETKERTIAYYISGNAKAKVCIFLLNGFAGPGPQFWINQFRYEYFVNNYKVISMDYFGSGKSIEKIENEYELSDMLKSIKLIMDAEKCTGSHLVGLSFGCVVAMEFAYYYPDYVKSMVLFSPSFRVSVFYERVLFAAREMLMRGSKIEDVFWLLIPWPFSDEEYNMIKNNEKDQIDVFSQYNTREALIKIIGMIINLNLKPIVEKLEVPTLLVAGKHDRISPVNNQIELDSYLPNSTLLILEDSGHVIGFFDTKILNTMIREHIAHIDFQNN